MSVSVLLFTATVTNKHFLFWWFVAFCSSSFVGEKQRAESRVVLRRGRCPSPSSPVAPVGCFLANPSSSREPAPPGLESGLPCLTKAPRFSVACLFLPVGGAVLLEGPPAACLSLRPVGGSGCIHSQGLLKWHHGFFSKELDSSLRLRKIGKKKKGDFSCIWMSGPPARTLGQRKQTRLHPSIQTSLAGGLSGPPFSTLDPDPCPEVSCRQSVAPISQ